MRSFIAASLAIAFLCCPLAAHAQGDPATRTERVQAAVKSVVAVQLNDGEAAAINALQACYQGLPEGQQTDKLEECLAQDIAYANFSAGMYRNTLKNAQQPEYASMDAMKVRVYAQARRAGLSQGAADQLLRAIAPVAIQSLVPAIQAARK